MERIKLWEGAQHVGECHMSLGLSLLYVGENWGLPKAEEQPLQAEPSLGMVWGMYLLPPNNSASAPQAQLVAL